jgi:two-component system, OmpR family, osmolarity sensor histidine kinase EnvZ
MTALIPPPASFARQALVTTIGLLFASQVLALIFIGVFVLRPQADRVGGIVAQATLAVSTAADEVTPAQRARMLAVLGDSAFLDVRPASAPPPKGGPRPGWLEMRVMRALLAGLKNQDELVWRTDPQRRLWVKVKIGPEFVWLTSRMPRAMNPFLAVLLSSAATFGLGLIAAFWAQHRITQPLSAMTAQVAALRPDSPAAPMPETGPSELVALSRGFNALSARLQAAERERALMLAGVSHDLRTPLAKLRLAVEMMPASDPVLAASAHAQVEQIDRILAQFLTFARGFAAEDIQTVDVDALVRVVVGAEVAVSGSIGPAPVRPEGLRRALSNLVENAQTHGGAPISVTLASAPGHIHIAVRDHGPGASSDALDQLAEPFFRGDAARSNPGAGLGLAIAAQVARAHGGELALANIPGGGFVATLALADARQKAGASLKPDGPVAE